MILTEQKQILCDYWWHHANQHINLKYSPKYAITKLLKVLFSLYFFFFFLPPPEVWCTLWWASSWLLDSRPAGIGEQTQRDKQRHQRTPLYTSHRWPGVFVTVSPRKRNRKPGLTDNVNVSVASARLHLPTPDAACRTAGQPFFFFFFWRDWNQRVGEAAGVCVAFNPQNIFLKGCSPPTPISTRCWSSRSTHCESPNTFRG